MTGTSPAAGAPAPVGLTPGGEEAADTDVPRKGSPLADGRPLDEGQGQQVTPCRRVLMTLQEQAVRFYLF